MEKVKELVNKGIEKVKALNKQQKIIGIVVVIIILGLVGIVVFMNNKGNNTDNVKNDSKAKVTTNYEIEEYLSAQDLINIYDENSANFSKNYNGAKIEFEGTIEKIQVKSDVIVRENAITTQQNKIFFKEGWCLVIGNGNTNIDLTKYKKGDKVQVTTGIATARWTSDFVKNASENKRVVWLVGNDRMNYDSNINNITTVINLVL